VATVARVAVFAYGSLVSPASAAHTLGRSVPRPLPANLAGWRRRWSTFRDNLAVEKTFARADGGGLPRYVLGLNLEPAQSDSDGEAPNGALLEVTEAELERLDLRELRYDRVDVTASVPADPGFERIVAYVAKREHFAPQPPPDCVVISSYMRALESAFRDLGPGELERFCATTGPPPVEVIEAVLVKDRIPPGNPRTW
jgi:cation transport regulator ChaC